MNAQKQEEVQEREEGQEEGPVQEEENDEVKSAFTASPDSAIVPYSWGSPSVPAWSLPGGRLWMEMREMRELSKLSDKILLLFI